MNVTLFIFAPKLLDSISDFWRERIVFAGLPMFHKDGVMFFDQGISMQNPVKTSVCADRFGGEKNNLQKSPKNFKKGIYRFV